MLENTVRWEPYLLSESHNYRNDCIGLRTVTNNGMPLQIFSSQYLCGDNQADCFTHPESAWCKITACQNRFTHTHKLQISHSSNSLLLTLILHKWILIWNIKYHFTNAELKPPHTDACINGQTAGILYLLNHNHTLNTCILAPPSLHPGTAVLWHSERCFLFPERWASVDCGCH